MSNFEIEYNGLTLDNTNGYVVNQLDGIHGIPIRTSENNLVDDDGGIIFLQRYAPRTVSINLGIFKSTGDNYFAAVAALLQAFTKSDGDIDFKLTPWTTAGTTRILKMRVITEPQIIESPGEVTVASRILIQLRADDPFYRDEAETTYGPVSKLSSTGTPIALPIPAPLGSIIGGTFTITNNGDISTYARFVLTGELVNPTITNRRTGESFSISTTINSGDYVELIRDNTGFSVLLNGTTNYLSNFGGTFFDIDTGDSEIALSATSGTGTMTAYFNPRYKTLT